MASKSAGSQPGFLCDIKPTILTSQSAAKTASAASGSPRYSPQHNLIHCRARRSAAHDNHRLHIAHQIRIMVKRKGQIGQRPDSTDDDLAGVGSGCFGDKHRRRPRIRPA